MCGMPGLDGPSGRGEVPRNADKFVITQMKPVSKGRPGRPVCYSDRRPGPLSSGRLALTELQ
jgi:hypothetical protein